MKKQMIKGTPARLTLFFRIFLLILPLIFFTAVRVSAQSDGQKRELQLTNAEREWLSVHPRIQVGIMDAWPPLNYIDQKGNPRGIGAEYLAALNKRLGNVLVPVPAPFKKNYDRVLKGELDALMDITCRPDREKLFCFTRPYIVIPHVIVGRSTNDYFKNEEDLMLRTIALEEGFYNVTYFKDNYPSVTIREYSETSEALDAVSRGEADAYAGNRAVVIYIIEKELMNNLMLMGKLRESCSTLQIGVQKDNPLLASILDKALASITEEEERMIRQKFLHEGSPGLDLTETEKAWLKVHPTFRVAFKRTWAPIEFFDKHDIPQGISSDYLRKMEDLLKINFDIVKGQDSENMKRDLKNHKLDMISSIFRTEEHGRYLNFTDNFLSFPIGIFNRQDAPYITSMSELNEKKIIVIKDHPTEYIFKSKHPDLQIISVPSVVSALKMLAQGDGDVIVGNSITYGYYLNQMRDVKIKLAGETPYRYELSMGVRRDCPELHSILNKALRAIPESEQNEIYYKWTSLQQVWKVDYVLIWKIVGGAFAVVAVFIFWNRRLGREITIRKKAEEQLQASQQSLMNLVKDLNLKKEELEAANHKLKELDHLKSMFIASMSHELRTPLNSIIGFTGIILQGMTGEINNEQKDQLQRVLKAGKHLLALITDVIDISKIEAGKIEAFVDEFTLNNLLDEALLSLKLQIKEKNLEIEMHTVPEKIILKTDRKRFFQCVLNYLSNAVKYSEKGKITVLAEDKGGKLLFSVTDTGIGIKEEDLPTLFQSFVRLDSNLKMTVSGTGLGLYLTKKLVTEVLGGEVTATSVYGKGSTFSLLIPNDLSIATSYNSSRK